MNNLDITITAKIKILPTDEQVSALKATYTQILLANNEISNFVFKNKELNRNVINEAMYYGLREKYKLKSQMAQSCMKTVIAKYKSAGSNGHEFGLIEFKKPEYDLVWNRDYSLNLNAKIFSINSLNGRLKIPFEIVSKEKYFDGTWSFGTAKLVYKFSKFFLHIPMTRDASAFNYSECNQVVGIDLGINFLATVYDSSHNTTFFSGKETKNKRAHFSKIRKELQQVKTSSSRKRLKSIGSRENRWMTDVNHRVTKALVEKYGSNTLFVIEDLSNVRQVTEKVRKRDRYISVSWAFYQFRQMLEYKAILCGSKVVTVNPRYTSQTCPMCGHVESSNRNKKLHVFKCKTCNYTSNDDRVAAMNLQNKGVTLISEGLYQ